MEELMTLMREMMEDMRKGQDEMNKRQDEMNKRLDERNKGQEKMKEELTRDITRQISRMQEEMKNEIGKVQEEDEGGKDDAGSGDSRSQCICACDQIKGGRSRVELRKLRGKKKA
uniref:Uncharacterized protein n=1 Tax=Rhodnius prolixus TaxID=13249 RepID=T1HMT2_RHOPR